MALNSGKAVQRREGRKYGLPVKAGATIYQGGLVMLASQALIAARAGQGADNAAKAVEAATFTVVGVASQNAQGGAQDGDVRLGVESCEVLLKNSAAADAITLADVGEAAFVVDDETVAKTSATNTRPKAGTITDVEPAGVWVRVGV